MSFFAEFIQPLLNIKSLASIPLLLLLFWVYLNYKALADCQDKPKSYQRAINLLKEDKLGVLYRNLLGWFLRKISHVIGDERAFKPKARVCQETQCHTLNPHNRFFSINPFTAPSYDFTLRLAFIYPIISFFIIWGIGGDTKIAGNPWPDEELLNIATEQRWYWLSGVFFLPLLLIIWLKNRKLWTHIISLLFISSSLALIVGQWKYFLNFWLIFLWLFISMYSAAWISAWLIYRNKTYAHSLAFQPSFAVAGAVAFAVAVAGAVAGAVAVAVAGAVAGAVAVAVAFAVAFAGTVAFAFAFAFAGAGTLFIIQQSIYQKAQQQHKTVWFWLIYTIGLFSLGIYLTTSTTLSDNYFLLFYFILPLVNAPIDWLSLGITRGLLHSISHQHHQGFTAFLWALLDIILAFVFLFLIAAVLVLVIGLINLFAQNPIPIHTILNELADPAKASNYYWVYALLFTTLIPTLIHFTIAGAALMLWLPQTYRHRLAHDLEQDHYKHWGATLYLSFTPLLGLLAPVALLAGLYWLIDSHHTTIGQHLLEWAKWLAE